MSKSFRRVIRVLAICGLTVASAGIGVGAAQATPPGQATVHTVSGCETGHPFTVRTPRSSSESSAQLAADLGASSNNTIFKKAASVHARWLSTLTCKARPKESPVLHSVPQQASYWDSSNWSGYVTGTQSANYAQLTWNVPSVTYKFTSAGSSLESMVVWPGIGGWNGESGSLVQDGTASEVVCNGATGSSCSSYTKSHYFWLEYVPGESMQEVTNLTPNVGDSVGTSVSYAASTGATFTLCDYTLKECVSGSQTPGSAPGHSAEWIVERPTYSTLSGDVLLPLPQFSQVAASGADYQVGSSGLNPASSGPGYSIDMYNGNDQLNSTSGLGSGGDNFSVTWVTAQ